VPNYLNEVQFTINDGFYIWYSHFDSIYFDQNIESKLSNRNSRKIFLEKNIWFLELILARCFKCWLGWEHCGLLPKTILNGTRPLVSGNDQTEVAHYALLPLNIWNSRLNVNAYANKLNQSSTRNEITLSRSAARVIEKPMKQYHKYYIKYNNISF